MAGVWRSIAHSPKSDNGSYRGGRSENSHHGNALLAAYKLFELAGTRATLEELNLDSHWRNARTHTLHDPVRWKFHAIGNYSI